MSYGLQMFNPSGELYFDSNVRLFRFHSYHFIAQKNNTAASTIYTISAPGVTPTNFALVVKAYSSGTGVNFGSARNQSFSNDSFTVTLYDSYSWHITVLRY